MIEFHAVSKVFRRRQRTLKRSSFRELLWPSTQLVTSLDNVTFTVPQGQLVGYIGPNGAGKSTTMKCLLGIIRPTSGRVLVTGLDPWRNRQSFLKNVGAVFGQRSLLTPDLPPADTFELMRRIYDIPIYEFSRRKEALVAAFDVGSYLQSPVRQLSLGQRMRCEVIAALLHRPRLLVLDEPTIGMDHASKQALLSTLKALRNEEGLTLMFTSHDLRDVESVCDRLLVINRSRLSFDGSADDLRKRVTNKQRVKIQFSSPEPVSLLRSRLGSVEVHTHSIDSITLLLESDAVAPLLAEMGVLAAVTSLQVENISLDEILRQWCQDT